MDFRHAIIAFLGLQDVKIIDLKISKKQRTVVVKVQQRRDSCFCRHCGEQFCEVKDWDLKVLRAPPLGVFQHVTVKFIQLRGRCDYCDRTSVAEVDWIHPKFSSMTCGFAEVAGRLMEEISCEAVGRILFLNSKTMWSLDQYRMETMMQYLHTPDDLDVSYLAADEVHFRTTSRLRQIRASSSFGPGDFWVF